MSEERAQQGKTQKGKREKESWETAQLSFLLFLLLLGLEQSFSKELFLSLRGFSFPKILFPRIAGEPGFLQV